MKEVMKNSFSNNPVKKIISFLLIVILFSVNSVWAMDHSGKYSDNQDTLAPALQMDTNIHFYKFYKVDVVKPWNKVDVVLKEQKPLDGQFVNTIEVGFKYDQIGMFDKILNAVGKEGKIIWFEMGSGKERKVFRFSVSTESKKNRMTIIENIKAIDDLPQNGYKYDKMNKCLLTLSVNDRVDTLKNITSYLSRLHINVSNFLTPTVFQKGRAQFVFELDVPDYINLHCLRDTLREITKGKLESVQINSGQLIDKILDEYLIDQISVPISSNVRKKLRMGLKTVAERHISQARKDRKTPFIMHPVEIAKIVCNEIGVLDEENLIYLSQAFRMKKEDIIETVLMAVILHDAVEDGDIDAAVLEKKYGKTIAEIVKMLTKAKFQKNKKGEVSYLDALVKRKDMIGMIAQIIKIADRIHNLRTLKRNSQEFQRKTVFSTIDNFVPCFIGKIDLKKIKNPLLKQMFIKSLSLFSMQIASTLQELQY